MVSYSWSSMLFGEIVGSLNPCCNGRWSRTELNKIRKTAGRSVLILVVMEDGLVHMRSDSTLVSCLAVLILVVMEDGLVLEART